MSRFDPLLKVWFGPEDDRNRNSLTFRESILETFRLTPEKVFQISDHDGTNLTYSQAELNSIRIAQNLKRFGVKPSDAVLAYLFNSTYATSIILGCALVGAPIQILDRNLLVDEKWIRHNISLANPKVIFIDEDVTFSETLVKAVKEEQIDCKIFFTSNHVDMRGENLFSFNELLKETNCETTFKISRDDGMTDESAAVILSSSGTTGPSKPVVLSGRSCQNMKYIADIREDIVAFSYSKLGIFSGLAIFLVSFLNNGTRIITKDEFAPESFGKLIRKHKITTSIVSVGNFISMCFSPEFRKNDFESIRELICGGEKVPSNVRKFWISNLSNGVLSVLYGATEVGIVSCCDQMIYDLSATTDNIVGKLRTNVQCKIVDVSTRKALGVNEAGEILFKTDSMFSEYFRSPELTEKAFEDGWYKTGDLGYFNENGHLVVHGRVADTIWFGGVKVHSAQIENYFESLDGVKKVCAVNVTEDNLVAMLCIVSHDSAICESFLHSKAAEKFKDGKFTGGIYIVDEIPRVDNVHKTDRKAAQLMALELMKSKHL